jgi:hypothetical protein
MFGRRGWALLVLLLAVPVTTAAANVVTDWDEKAVNIVQPAAMGPLPPLAFRNIAIVHVAMFDAVNSIEPRYKPYKVRLPATPDTSKEAAAAAAAAAVLVKLVPDAAADVQSTLTSYLATLPDGEAKSKGIQLGQEVGAKILETREKDGASAPDAYRPKTRAGCLYTDADHVRLAIGDHDTLRASQPVAIPREAAAVAEERGMGEGLQ